MTMLEAAAAVVLCAAIVIAVLMLKEEMMMPLHPGKDISLYFLIGAEGDAESLEQTAKGLCWMCRQSGARAEIFISDRGMTAEARKLAEILAGEDEQIKLIPLEKSDGTIEEIVCRRTNNT